MDVERKNFGFIWAEVFDDGEHKSFSVYRLDANNGKHLNTYQDRDLGNLMMAVEWLKKKTFDI